MQFERIFPVETPKFKDGILVDTERLNFFRPISSNCTDPESKEIELIMIKDYGYVGNQGEIVKVSKSLARSTLLPEKYAIYKSPENLAWLDKIKLNDAKFCLPKLDVVSKQIADKLQMLHLPIYMNQNRHWTLNEKHVKVALRAAVIF